MEEPEKIVSQTELDDEEAQKAGGRQGCRQPPARVYRPDGKDADGGAADWAAFQVWANMFGTLGAVKLRTAHIMFLLPLAFTLYPTLRRERRRRRLMPVWDIALIAAAILSYGYLFLRYDAVARTGRLNSDGRVGRRGLPAGRALRRRGARAAIWPSSRWSSCRISRSGVNTSPARSARAPLRSSASSRRWCGIPTAFSVRARAFPRRISSCSCSSVRFSNTAAFPNSSTISR